MSKPGSTGRLVLNTHSQAALWEHELTGQMSDGMWENSRPWEHYKFWCRLEVVVDPAVTPFVEARNRWEITKKSYAFARLFNVEIEGRFPIRDRMVNTGRMAIVFAEIGAAFGCRESYVMEYMPSTFEEYNVKVSVDTHLAGLIAQSTITYEQVKSYYKGSAAAYGLKEMKRDVIVISSAMKNVVEK